MSDPTATDDDSSTEPESAGGHEAEPNDDHAATGQSASDSEEATEDDGPDSDASTTGRISQSLLKVGMVILILLGLVATFRFYFAASNAISIWFSSDFVPIFQAAFNLLLLVGSILGLSMIVRRLR